MVFTVSLSSPAPATVIVEYSVFDGNADASDYSAGSGTLEFRPGQRTKTSRPPSSAIEPWSRTRSSLSIS